MPLSRHADGVWSADALLPMPGFSLPIRMTVLRLPSGALWLHSPIAIDDALAAELAALGPVAHIVSPSLLHHLFAAPALARYPDARLWCAPGLPAKRPDVAWHATLDPADLPQAWGNTISAQLIEGAPGLNELVFFHQPSRTLLVTDLLFNIVNPPSFSASLALTLTGTRGKLALSRAWRFAFIKDRAATARSVRALLQWPIERLLPCHGDPIEQGAHPLISAVLAPIAA
jgi:hypothetical protein